MTTNDHSDKPVFRRSTALLLGLVMALATMLVALEYTSVDGEYEGDDDTAELRDRDLTMMSPVQKNDMVSAVQGAAPKALTENVKAADNVNTKEQEISPVTSKLVIGDGEGVAPKANVTEALPQTPAQLDTAVVKTVEQLPEYPGGIVEFMKWITKNLHYPNAARQGKIKGKVVVSFIVNKDGSVSNIKLEQSDHNYLATEVLRVMRMMPKWKPGMMNAKPCRTMVAIPVIFDY